MLGILKIGCTSDSTVLSENPLYGGNSIFIQYNIPVYQVAKKEDVSKNPNEYFGQPNKYTAQRILTNVYIP